MNKTGLTVIKASGEEVLFEVDKLKNSLKRAGADDLLAHEIADRIHREMQNRTTTKEIYKRAFRALKKKQRGMAGRYSLKKAILELGPAGYPFEKFIARLLEYEGYQVDTNIILKGKCISHEVDVRAISDHKIVFIECKYHADQGRPSDVKTSLYFLSRFRDLAEGKGTKHRAENEGWLVTNTRFSEDAIQFANCMGFRVISWNYPVKESLKDLVEKSGLHPVTCLTSMTRHEKSLLIEEDILLCRELLHKPGILEKVIGNKKRVEKVTDEAHEICQL